MMLEVFETPITERSRLIAELAMRYMIARTGDRHFKSGFDEEDMAHRCVVIARKIVDEAKEQG